VRPTRQEGKKVKRDRSKGIENSYTSSTIFKIGERGKKEDIARTVKREE